jgi:hypothetical protein
MFRSNSRKVKFLVVIMVPLYVWFTQSINEVRTKFFWYYCNLGKVFFKYKNSYVE